MISHWAGTREVRSVVQLGLRGRARGCPHTGPVPAGEASMHSSQSVWLRSESQLLRGPLGTLALLAELVMVPRVGNCRWRCGGESWGGGLGGLWRKLPRGGWRSAVCSQPPSLARLCQGGRKAREGRKPSEFSWGIHTVTGESVASSHLHGWEGGPGGLTRLGCHLWGGHGWGFGGGAWEGSSAGRGCHWPLPWHGCSL